MRRTIHLITLAVLIGLFVGSTVSFAYETDFHGYLESRAIGRDTNGVQYGFMDHMFGVQWIQELQLDLEVRPSYEQGQPLVRFEKAFFRYRGAYDAIFDTSNQYNEVRDEANSRFEPGKRQLRWDQDLRECFADLVAENKYGDKRANLRLGKQIVMWGESDGFNLMNIVNPSDYYNKAFFSNPEDLAAPLWMARFDGSLPGSGFVNSFNLQLLAIPEFRPATFGPYLAPYQLGAPYVDDTDGSWGGDNWEFGARVGATMASTNVYLHYFNGKQDGPAVDISTLADGYLTLSHPDSDSYGFSFNHFVGTGNFIFRGEGSFTTDKSFTDYEDPAGRGYTLHDFYQVLIAIDKSFSAPPIGTNSALSTSFQIYYSHVDGYSQDDMLRPAPEDTWRATLLLSTDYLHGSISPNIFVLYDSEDAWLISPGVTYSPDAKWYFTVSMATVWGDKDGHGDYNPYIGSSGEVALKVGYKW
ncbi:DUF1302 family protein [uncultured Desulfosarcina sp.]|uniref:DUF1302 family protein n=1 Tax=uncultured Desulfosarcina sp. TaxID=218289 RepID=UPI0029C9037F|nr:DUF1302 family protein [uncultured Desulfosarcina sp.]